MAIPRRLNWATCTVDDVTEQLNHIAKSYGVRVMGVAVERHPHGVGVDLKIALSADDSWGRRQAFLNAVEAWVPDRVIVRGYSDQDIRELEPVPGATTEDVYRLGRELGRIEPR